MEFSARRACTTAGAFVIVARVISGNAMLNKKEDLIRKLVQIQEQARITMEELPPTQKLARDRLKLVVGLAGYIATAIQLEERSAEPVAAAMPEAAPRKTLQ
jgi:hypothetical protein